MSARERDLAWEALVRETHANPAMGRGMINAALKAIRAAWELEGGLPDDLHEEIVRRADAYRIMWPTMSLTPTALAVHWHRVIAQRAPARTPQQQAFDAARERNSGNACV